MAAETAVFELAGWPRATVTKNGALLSVVIDDIDGIEPDRSPSVDETTRGISSLDPPTAATDQGANELVALAGEAVAAAIRSTVGSLSVPDEAIVRHKVTVAVCGALRDLDVDV